MAKTEYKTEDQSIDIATIEMLDKAAKDGVATAFERAAAMKPCPIGGAGSCCRICSMGPCRLPAPRNKVETLEEKDERRGVCGATIETIAARNFVRMIAAGASAHSDHGRTVAETFLKAAKGEGSDFKITDEQKLMQVALDFGIEIGDRSVQEIAIAVGEVAVAEFGKYEGTLNFLKRAPLKRQQIWEELNVKPRNIDREVVECLHRTSMGVDLDFEHLFQQGARAALADGWGGSMIATELQDIMLGTPVPVTGKVNLGILGHDTVNIIVHGHEPLLPEMLVIATREPELIEMAKAKGASGGIQLGGICCSANETLMRHGVPLAGNMLQQEVAVVSGAVEAMVVDVQCIMQSLPKVAECYHTEIFTTSDKAKLPGATHIEFDEAAPLEAAREIVRRAINNYPNRILDMVNIPDHTMDLVAGFSHETIGYLLGGLFRASYKPLNENIINGRIRGVAGVVGCTNPRVKHEDVHVRLVQELIKNDVLVIQTGCAAMACAKYGLLTPEAASQAGPGLREVCEAVGIPPVLHMGSCVDNSRILMAATAMVKEGGLGDDLADLPVAGAAPEWMSEKAITIGHYFVSSGVYTVFGVTWPTLGSEEVTEWLFEGMGEAYGGKWAFEPDPIKMAKLMIDHIDAKRKALGLDKGKERVLFDMDMRRELEAV